MARESKFTQSELYQATRHLLLQHGYAGFQFGLLAEQLNVTRAALYKYFRNKDELITEFMAYEMERFLQDLEKIKTYRGFLEQLDFLLGVILKYSEIHQILSIVFQIPKSKHAQVNRRLQQLKEQHERMYAHLNHFIQLGKREGILKSDLPDHVMLGFILQTVNIPNLAQLPDEEWQPLLKEALCYGIFRKKNN